MDEANDEGDQDRLAHAKAGKLTTILAITTAVLVTVPQAAIFIGFEVTKPATQVEWVGTLTAHRWASVLFGVTMATNLIFVSAWLFAIKTDRMYAQLQASWKNTIGVKLMDILTFRESLYVTLTSTIVACFYFIWIIYGVVIWARLSRDATYAEGVHDTWLLADLVHASVILVIYLALVGVYGRGLAEPYVAIKRLAQNNKRFL